MSVTRNQRMAGIAMAIRIFVADDQTVEVRALGQRLPPLSGCFRGDQALDAAGKILDLESQGYQLYFTPNPLRTELAGTATAARDTDVLSRRWLLIDVDPVRPSHTSSTDAEKLAGWDVLDHCRRAFVFAGFENLVIGDSGNGWHLCVPVDLPNDEVSREAHRKLLRYLQPRFAKDRPARIDNQTYNAARIWKIYGTLARKGNGEGDRPWRYSRWIEGCPWQQQVAQANNPRVDRLLAVWEAQDQESWASPGASRDRIIVNAQAYVAQEPIAISGQGGHNRTFHVACILVKGFALDEQEAFIAIQRWNERCEPPWSERELQHKIHDAMLQPGETGYLLRPGRNSHDRRDRSERAGRAEQQASAVNGEEEEKPRPAAEPAPDEPPIPLSTLPPAPKFPLSVFDGRLARYCEEVAWATHSPLDYVAVPMLAIASGALGNSRRLAITRSHVQPAIVFAAVVGPQGSGKSPALDLVTEPLHKLERERYVDWKHRTEAIAEGEPKPALERCLLDDVTTERMVDLLQDNPRGLIMVRDELAALVTGMNQYKDGGKGSDRQVFLKLWPGAAITVDRKSNPNGVPIKVRFPCVCIIGGIQPAVVEWLRGEQRGGKLPPDDGFLDRFAITYPEPLPAAGEDWREVSVGASQDWETALRTLFALNMILSDGDNAEKRPHFVGLSNDGRPAWQAFTEAHAEELNHPEFAEHLRGPWAKLRGYCGRLALVLHSLRQVFEPALLADIDAESIERAARLIVYFKAHTARLHMVMGSDPRIADAVNILKWLKMHREVDVISRRDLYRHLRLKFRTPESMDGPLRLLAEHRYLTELDSDNARATKKYRVSALWNRAGDNGDSDTAEE